MNQDTFLRALLLSCHDRDWMDVEGDVLQDLMVKHGLRVTRLATAEDCETDWGQENDVEVGDEIHPLSDELVAFMEWGE